MRASTWRSILDFGPDDDRPLSSWLESKEAEIGLDRASSWYHDQWITTHSLLKSQVCTAPAYSGLWRVPGLESVRRDDDVLTCFHGYGYKDCNEAIRVVFQGCKWWHFYPWQTFEVRRDWLVLVVYLPKKFL